MLKRINEMLNKNVDDVDKVALTGGLFALMFTLTVIVVSFVDTVSSVKEFF